MIFTHLLMFVQLFLWEMLKSVVQYQWILIIGTILFAIIIGNMLYRFKLVYVHSSTDEKLANSIKAKLSEQVWCFTKIIGVNSGIGKGPFFSTQYFVLGLMHHEIIRMNQGEKFSFSIHMICSEETLKKLEGSEENCGASVKVFNYDAARPFGHSLVMSKLNNFPVIESFQQSKIVKALLRDVNIGAGALIVGPPGSGKSHIAEIFARKLVEKGISPNLVYGFDPTIKGANFELISSKTKPSEKSPLIIAMDEFDKLILKAHNGLQSEYHNFLVSDKPTLSNFMDKLGNSKHIVYIATSNEPLSWFEKKENEYVVREGRISHKFELVNMNYVEFEVCFLDACKKYNINAKVPAFEDLEGIITIARLEDAFRRCHGCVDTLYERLCKKNPS